MKILVLAIILMIGFPIFADQSNKWEGIYTFEEESWDENGVRSYRWFRLQVVKKDGKTLDAIYSDGENGNTYRKYLLKTIPDENSASFVFEADLTYIDISCSMESIWQKGEKFMEFKEINKDGKRIVQTFWGKENLGSQSESGGNRPDKVFFKKVR